MTDNPQLKVVPIAQAAPDADLIESCEQLLASARDGSLRGLVTTSFTLDGAFSTRLHGGMTNVEAIAALASSLHDVIEISRAINAP